jgi:hypothetical protein
VSIIHHNKVVSEKLGVTWDIAVVAYFTPISCNFPGKHQGNYENLKITTAFQKYAPQPWQI